MSFSSPRGANSRNSAELRHLSDLTRVFLRCLFDSRVGNCDIAAMIRILSAKVRRVQAFSNCGSERGARYRVQGFGYAPPCQRLA